MPVPLPPPLKLQTPPLVVVGVPPASTTADFKQVVVVKTGPLAAVGLITTTSDTKTMVHVRTAPLGVTGVPTK